MRERRVWHEPIGGLAGREGQGNGAGVGAKCSSSTMTASGSHVAGRGAPGTSTYPSRRFSASFASNFRRASFADSQVLVEPVPRPPTTPHATWVRQSSR